MADVKNFGLVGVGSNVQFGKAGSKIVLDAGTFKFRNAANGGDVALTAGDVTSSGAVTAATGVTATTGGVTASAGNLTATLGNLALGATSATVSIGGDTTLSRHAAGVFKLDGSAAVVLPLGNDAAKPTGTAGMIRANNQGLATAIEYFDGSAWQTIATSSNAGALGDEVQAIRTSLGDIVDATTGIYNTTALNALYGTDPADLTTALNNLAGNIALNDSLDEIFPSTATGGVKNVIYADPVSNLWVQAAPGATSGVQGYDAGLAALAAKTTTGILVQTGDDTFESRSIAVPTGMSITNADGVAGNPTIALANDLAALEGLTGTGFAVRTGADTWVQRSFVAPTQGITISNEDGVSGNVTFALANDLAALEGLTTIGYMVRTGDGTASTRTMNVVSGDLAITGDANGETTDTTFGLATVSQASSGNFVKVTLDTKGRVTGNTAVTTEDITALADTEYLRLDGTTTMAADINAGGFKVTNLAAPVASTDAATKGYVDSAVTGMTWKNAVRVKAATNVTVSGPGSAIDGVTLANGDRVLLTGQTTSEENGIYVFNGAASAMTRSTDADVFGELSGAAVFVMEGSSADTGWTQNTELTSFAGQSWAQFAGGGAYSGGAGITITGATISADIGAGLVDVAGQTTVDTLTGNAVQIASNKVQLVLNGAGLEQSASGLKISAAGVTNAMLANNKFVLNADSGTDATGLELGDTLQIRGTSTQGITTALSVDPDGNTTFAITASDASASQKGVATFDATEFTVTAGNVELGTIGNSKLANSFIKFAADSGTADNVELGETFTLQGDSYISTAVTANKIALTLGTVDVAHGGTGKTSFVANQLIYGNGTSELAQSALLSFDAAATNPTLTLGSTTIAGGTGANPDMTITAATGGDISLVPAAGQSVIIAGAVGDSTIQSDAGTGLTVRGNTTLTLESGTGSTSMKLTSGTTAKVSVSGPSATDYATGLAANDLTNKQYVDTAIASGAAAGAIKAFTVTVSGAGTTDIGSAMPAGATVLSVKVQVTTAEAGATIAVGKAGSTGAYMSAAENDAETVGMYVAETYVTEASATQAIATVTGAAAAKIVVQYQVAQ